MGGGGPVADLPGQRTDQHEGKFTAYVAMVTLVAVRSVLRHPAGGSRVLHTIAQHALVHPAYI